MDGLGIEDLKEEQRFLLLVVLAYQAALESRKKMAANDIPVPASLRGKWGDCHAQSWFLIRFRPVTI